ncbi:MAG: non-canonical purine NTP pyrophosphatase, partial [Ilumatobacteraceae bacterium]
MTAPDPVRSTLVCASANPDKVAEIEAILGTLVDLVPRPPEIPDVVEDADTLEGNARLKAVAICEATGQAAVADERAGARIRIVERVGERAYLVGVPRPVDEPVDHRVQPGP